MVFKRWQWFQTSNIYYALGDAPLRRLGEYVFAIDVILRAGVCTVLKSGALDRPTGGDDWLYRESAHAITCERTIVPILKDGFRPVNRVHSTWPAARVSLTQRNALAALTSKMS